MQILQGDEFYFGFVKQNLKNKATTFFLLKRKIYFNSVCCRIFPVKKRYKLCLKTTSKSLQNTQKKVATKKWTKTKSELP